MAVAQSKHIIYLSDIQWDSWPILFVVGCFPPMTNQYKRFWRKSLWRHPLFFMHGKPPFICFVQNFMFWLLQKKLKKKDTLASFNLHNYVLLKKEKGLDHCCYYRTTSSVRKAYLRSCLLKHNNVLVVAAGPGENETASWTHSKENLSAEDTDRSVVSCRPVGLYLAVSLVKECIYSMWTRTHNGQSCPCWHSH